MPERIVALADDVSAIASHKVTQIQLINASARLLALNAQIEAVRVGDLGAGFAVVAKEVKSISNQIDGVATELGRELKPRLVELEKLGRQLVATVRGTRLADLALNLIEIIDRNLYERSCDVRWWATDSAVVAACSDRSPDAMAFTSRRLGIILDSYTVYLDLVVCDLDGTVLAHGRTDQFPALRGSSMAHQAWFREGLNTADGTRFTVADVSLMPELDGSKVLTYATAIREDGETTGRPIGVLGILFDWSTQAQTVVDGVRLNPEERARTRALIIDAQHRVLAASDGCGVLDETFPLQTEGQTIGHSMDANGTVVGFALTPGYETYRGLGWYGVLVQRR